MSAIASNRYEFQYNFFRIVANGFYFVQNSRPFHTSRSGRAIRRTASRTVDSNDANENWSVIQNYAGDFR